MGTGIIDLWDAVACYWQDQDEVVGFESQGQPVPQTIRPATTLVDQSLGQLTRAILRMILQLLPLISSRSANHPGVIKGKFLHNFAQVVGPVSVRAALEMCSKDKLTAEQQTFCSDPAVLQAIALGAVLTVMQLRKLQAESQAGAGAGASSSTTAVAQVPCHHVGLLKALQLGDAVEALTEAAHTRATMSSTDAVRAAQACRQVYLAAIYVFSKRNSRGSSSGPENPSNASNIKQGWLEFVTSNQQPSLHTSTCWPDATSWPDATIPYNPPKAAASCKHSSPHSNSSQQSGQLQQQQLRDLLDLLPYVFGVLLELQLLAQQLHPVAPQLQNLRGCDSRQTSSNIVWESFNLEDAQQWAAAAMTWIFGDYSDGLVDMLLSQPQGLVLEVVAHCSKHLHTSMRAFGTMGASNVLGPLVELLNRLLLWSATSSASGQRSVDVPSNLSVPGVCGLLLTWSKCEAAWLQTVSNSATDATPNNTSTASARNSNTGGTQRVTNSDRVLGDDTESIVAYNMAYSLKPVYDAIPNSRAAARVQSVEKLAIMIYLTLLTASTGVRVAGVGGLSAARAGLQAGCSSFESAAAAGLMLAGRCLYVAGQMTIKGKHLMQPDMAVIHSPTLAPGKYVSVPWELIEEMLAGLDVLLPLLMPPEAPGAAQAAAARLNSKYQHLRQAVLDGRTGKLVPLQGGFSGAKCKVLALVAEHDTIVAERMSTFGAALCAQLPVAWCCNNPACLNLSCKSEEKLVSGKNCAGCKQARYCGPQCQKEHWGQHKTVCKTLR